jgi:hypothetical protein
MRPVAEVRFNDEIVKPEPLEQPENWRTGVAAYDAPMVREAKPPEGQPMVGGAKTMS